MQSNRRLDKKKRKKTDPLHESPLVPRRHTTTHLFVVLCWCCVWVIYPTQITHFDSQRVRSQMLCAQWTCHVFSGLAYLVSPFPVSRATGSCTRTFPFLFHMFFHLYRYGLSTRTLTFLAYVFLLLSRRLVLCLSFLLTLTCYVSSTRLPSRYS